MNMIEKRKAMAGQGGFTLIELLVVIAILAILAGAAIVGIGAMRGNAKKQACKSDKDTVQTAAEAYQLDDDKPDASITIANMVTDGYLKKVSDSNWSSLSKVSGEWVATPNTTSGKYQGVTGC